MSYRYDYAQFAPLTLVRLSWHHPLVLLRTLIAKAKGRPVLSRGIIGAMGPEASVPFAKLPQAAAAAVAGLFTESLELGARLVTCRYREDAHDARCLILTGAPEHGIATLIAATRPLTSGPKSFRVHVSVLAETNAGELLETTSANVWPRPLPADIDIASAQGMRTWPWPSAVVAQIVEQHHARLERREVRRFASADLSALEAMLDDRTRRLLEHYLELGWLVPADQSPDALRRERLLSQREEVKECVSTRP